MAIDGKRFLKVSQARFLVIDAHALARLGANTGNTGSLGQAYKWFKSSQQVTYEERRRKGFRPAYHPRKKRGVDSWYFHLKDAGQDLYAVLRPGHEPGHVEWITTYAPNPLSQARRYQ